MYETPEIGSMTPTAASTGRVFFCIYYLNPTLVPDAAFERAATTWQQAICQAEGFRPGSDIFMRHAVRTEPQFRAAWNLIATQATRYALPVWVGNVLSHASKDTRDDGLEFTSVRNDGTISHADIAKLTMLPWDNHGYLILSGCNTGLLGAHRAWCPAQRFAQTQRIRTVGQVGYAYFSARWNSYAPAHGQSRVVLWAFRRGRNGRLSSGIRMQGRVFSP